MDLDKMEATGDALQKGGCALMGAGCLIPIIMLVGFALFLIIGAALT
jgi:hypothetical protein